MKKILMLALVAATLASTPAVAQSERVVVLNMSAQCGRAAEYRDRKTLDTARKLLREASQRGESVTVHVQGSTGVTVGSYVTAQNVPTTAPVVWRVC